MAGPYPNQYQDAVSKSGDRARYLRRGCTSLERGPPSPFPAGLPQQTHGISTGEAIRMLRVGSYAKPGTVLCGAQYRDNAMPGTAISYSAMRCLVLKWCRIVPDMA
eukprot:3940991-Rhodomonas_salina.4